MEEMLYQGSFPSLEYSHPTMDPVWPLSVMEVEEPLQTVAAAGVAEPPTLAGATVTVDMLEFTAVQLPLCTTAR